MANNNGFALVEALIATAIVSGVGAAVIHLLDTDRAMRARAASQLRHVLAAEAIIERVGLDVPLRVQRTSGQLRDGATWMIDIVPFEEGGQTVGRFPLLKITVRISSQQGKGIPIELQTLKVPDVAP